MRCQRSDLSGDGEVEKKRLRNSALDHSIQLIFTRIFDGDSDPYEEAG